LDDTIAIAALYRTLVRRVFLNPGLNADLDAVSRAIVVENKWRAQRYGIHETFVDEVRRHGVPLAHWLDEVIDQAAGDADALGCLNEVEHCRAIVANGTSADAQLAVYRQARDEGAGREEALAAVGEWLAETTLGLDNPSLYFRPKTPHLGPATPNVHTHPEGQVPHVARFAEASAVHFDRDLRPDVPAI
jgi:carboxylate-amine ligase